jgi:hypothetical protein
MNQLDRGGAFSTAAATRLYSSASSFGPELVLLTMFASDL